MARVWQHQAQRQMTRFVTGTTHPHYSQVASAHTQYRTHRILFAQDAAEFFLDLPQVAKAPQLRRPSKHLVRCYSTGTVGVLDEDVLRLPSPRFLLSLHHPLERLCLGVRRNNLNCDAREVLSIDHCADAHRQPVLVLHRCVVVQTNVTVLYRDCHLRARRGG